MRENQAHAGPASLPLDRRQEECQQQRPCLHQHQEDTTGTKRDARELDGDGGQAPGGSGAQKRSRAEAQHAQQEHGRRHAAAAAGADGSNAGHASETLDRHVVGEERQGAQQGPVSSWPGALPLPCPPVPLPGVTCDDLPPAPPKYEPSLAEPLTPAALAALSRQDAATHDLHLRLLRFDDALAELASTRGLLVRFLVRPARQARGGADELVVEAPESMTVEYLKRRVARAKLLRGEFLPTSRFVLRKRAAPGGGASSGGAGPSSSGASGGGGGGALEELPSALPNGDEVFLASLGYEAPGPYELFIASAPQTTDREQQERMVAELSSRPHQPALGRQQQQHGGRGSGHARRATGAAGSAEVQGARGSFQALLHVQAGQAGSPGGSGAAGGGRRGAAASNSGAASAPGNQGPPAGDGWDQPRRQAGRWDVEEVAALVDGVQAFGTSWAKIHAAYVPTGRISLHRTQVDLKDKWRNLVRLVRGGPGRQARTIDLTEEQRQAILSIAVAPGGDQGEG